MTFKRHPSEISTTWIVVADRSRARILTTSDDNSDLTEVETLINPEGSMKQSDTVSDHQGRFPGRGGMPVSGQPRTDFEHKTAETFAIQVVDFLDAGRNSQQFGRVILIAAPAFLGTLRQKLPAPLARMVALEVDKDYTKRTPAEIATQLAKMRVAEG